MGVCSECSYAEGVCPVRSPYNTECKFKDAEVKPMDELRSKRNMAMKEDYLKGMTVAELSVKYGLHKSNVAKNLKKVGVKLNGSCGGSKPKVFPEETINRVLELIDEGVTYADIAKQMGMSLYHVKKIIGERRAALSAAKTEITITPEEERKEDISEMKGFVELKSHTFFMPGLMGKPSPDCFPTEKDNNLVWGIKIDSIDQLLKFCQETGCIVAIDGDNLLLLDRVDSKGRVTNGD